MENSLKFQTLFQAVLLLLTKFEVLLEAIGNMGEDLRFIQMWLSSHNLPTISQEV